MTQTYNVTGENAVDQVSYTVAASSKREAISKARKIAGIRFDFRRHDGRVDWRAEEEG